MAAGRMSYKVSDPVEPIVICDELIHEAIQVRPLFFVVSCGIGQETATETGAGRQAGRQADSEREVGHALHRAGLGLGVQVPDDNGAVDPARAKEEITPSRFHEVTFLSFSYKGEHSRSHHTHC